jgi:hypothetical protein
VAIKTFIKSQNQRKVGNPLKILLLSLALAAFWAGSAGAQFYPVGDLNGDRNVNYEDLWILAGQWLNPNCLSVGCDADLDGNSKVNMTDLAMLAEHWRINRANAVISEFMASNASKEPLEEGELLDEDGDSSDWIELYNPTNKPINLDGWYLTHDSNEPEEWQFPSVQLIPGQFLVVFASEKNRRVPGMPLHTNFNLNADGDYLALVEKDGVTIAHEYAPKYPKQVTDISYGLSQYATTFIGSGATVSYRVPTISDAGANWTALDFNDSGWKTGRTGLGFGNAIPGFKVTYYKANITVDSLSAAESVISNPSYQSTVVTAMASVINYLNTGDSAHYVNDQPFPGTTIGSDVENFVILATGTVSIPQTGPWTFGVNSDDGFELKLTKGTTTFTTSYPPPRGPADTLATFNITETGLYNLRLVFYEQGGGSELELFAAKGSFTTFNSTFRLVGDTANGGLSVSSMSEDVGTDIQQQMQNVNASLWVRAKFDVEEADFFDSISLQMKFKDAFVAYLNGQEIVRSSYAPTLPQWNSSATGVHDANEFENFDISDHIGSLREGRNVLAIHALNNSKSDGKFLILPELSGSSNQMTPRYFAAATPGKFNVSGSVNFVADTQFSHDRGFYDAPFSVTITTETQGATIHYTTDGSTPSEADGNDYTGPIPVNTTTCLRAMAFKPGWISTNVDTQTYIFLYNVIHQPSNPSKFPSTWGSVGADYEMDPDVVNNPLYRDLMRDSLLSLPTMSIVTSIDYLFGSSGIYSNPWLEGVAGERPTSVEWIYPDGTTGFQVDAGVRIYGGAFRGMELTRKKSFRLLFKRNYGQTKLEYPLFGENATDKFDTIILRAGANDAWNNWGAGNTQYIVDEFMRRTQLATGNPSAHGTFVHLYLNGLYWGLYNAVERPDESFDATYFGGDKEDWDSIHDGVAVNGDTATWNQMLNKCTAGLSSNEAYQEIQGNNADGTKNPAYTDLLDVDNHIDYMFSNLWGGTGDWPWHNWYTGCLRPPNATGFKFFNWDSEGAIIVWSDLNTNVTGVSDGAAVPYNALRQNAEFCLLFADHAHRHLFNNGSATQAASYARYKELADQVELAIISESARWGDMASGTPYTLANWQTRRNYILSTYMPQRPAIVLQQLRSAGLYPNVDAPVFYINGLYRYGGHILPTDVFSMTANTGTIYYTLNGTDPRIPTWQSPPNTVTLVPEDAAKKVLVPSVANGGNLLSSTLPLQVTYYKANIPVVNLATAKTVISTPAYQSSVATEKALVINYYNTGEYGHFDNDSNFPGTVINSDVDDFVIQARGSVLIPSTGYWTFGVSSDDGYELKLTRGATTFTSTWPNTRSTATDAVAAWNVTEAGIYDMNLVFFERSGGSEIELFAAKGYFFGFNSTSFHLVGDVDNGGLQLGENNIWVISYFNDPNWTNGTGGVGYERRPTDPVNYTSFIDVNVGSAMYNKNGSCYIRIPFTATHTEFTDMTLKVRYDDGFIAYLNGTEVARRNFTGTPAWNSLASSEHSDSAAIVFEDVDVSAYIKKTLRQGNNILAIHGMNITANNSDFLISAELVASEISQGKVSPAAIKYTGPVTIARSTDVKSRAISGITWSPLNEAIFAVGPVAENLRITEIMYHPQGTNDPNKEFIELKNIGATALNLNLVKFTEGIDFTFPSIELVSGGYVMVVKDLAAFQAEYGTGINVAGQYTGSLENAGERIRLEDAVGQTILDFKYKDGWRDITDGGGFSLTIINPSDPNINHWSEKDYWRASAYWGGSPGEDDSGILPNPGDVVINELLAHSHAGEPDWIELHNTTGEPINISGWFLSDDEGAPMKYQVAEDTVIDRYGYVIFREDLNFANPNDVGCCLEVFRLSENGEEVCLSSAQGGVLTGYQEVQDFGASETGISFGRYFKASINNVDFVAMSEPTPGWDNAYPKVGPIVINEIMYNPLINRDAEFVEIYNITNSKVDLFDVEDNTWKFNDEDYGIDYNLPANTSMPAHGYLLLVKNKANFKSWYPGVPAGVQLLEWGDGRLNNGGEKIYISMPGDVDQSGTRHYIRVDMINYDDEAPWPIEPDGNGASLRRLVANHYGNDPNNWTYANPPTPGQ